MTLKKVRDRFAVPLECVADQIKARPMGALVVWVVSPLVVGVLSAPLFWAMPSSYDASLALLLKDERGYSDSPDDLAPRRATACSFCFLS